MVIKKVYKNEFLGIIGFIYIMFYIIFEVILLLVWKLKLIGWYKSLVNILRWSLKGKIIFELLYLEWVRIFEEVLLFV